MEKKNIETFKLMELPPPPNFELQTGDLSLQFTVKRTLLNRLKYWLFCKFFPFKIGRWDK